MTASTSPSLLTLWPSVNSVGLRPVVAIPASWAMSGARKERELDAALEIEENNRAMLELGADDAFGRKAKPIAIKLERRHQVIDADRNHT
jgi:hypothetical protein